MTHKKFEWQAGETCKNIYECLIQFRPSGVRAKRPDRFSTLVAMNHPQIVVFSVRCSNSGSSVIRVFSTRTLHPPWNFNPKGAARQSLRFTTGSCSQARTGPPCAPLPRQSPPSCSFSFYRRPDPARSPLSATERNRRRDGVGVKQKYQRLTRGEEVKENNAEKGAKKERTTPLSRSTPRPFKNRKGFPDGNIFLFFHSSARRGPLRFVFPTPPYFCSASSPRPRSPHGSAHGALRCRFAPRVRCAVASHPVCAPPLRLIRPCSFRSAKNGEAGNAVPISQRYTTGTKNHTPRIA